jgi:hypothetical protein
MQQITAKTPPRQHFAAENTRRKQVARDSAGRRLPGVAGDSMLDFGAARHGFSADDTPEGRMAHEENPINNTETADFADCADFLPTIRKTQIIKYNRQSSIKIGPVILSIILPQSAQRSPRDKNRK